MSSGESECILLDYSHPLLMDSPVPYTYGFLICQDLFSPNLPVQLSSTDGLTSFLRLKI